MRHFKNKPRKRERVVNPYGMHNTTASGKEVSLKAIRAIFPEEWKDEVFPKYLGLNHIIEGYFYKISENDVILSEYVQEFFAIIDAHYECKAPQMDIFTIDDLIAYLKKV